MAEEKPPLGIDPSADLRHTRWNILLRGVGIDTYLGATIALDSGGGPVCSPSTGRPALCLDGRHHRPGRPARAARRGPCALHTAE